MRTLKELAEEALAVQDACNLSGVAQTFARVMRDLCELAPGTDARNTHPIAVLWADKIAHLTGTQSMNDRVAEAYIECHSLSEGKSYPWPRATWTRALCHNEIDADGR